MADTTQIVDYFRKLGAASDRIAVREVGRSTEDRPFIAAVITSAGLDRPDEVKKFFAEYMEQKDKARDVIRLSLERLDINLRMREAN